MNYQHSLTTTPDIHLITSLQPTVTLTTHLQMTLGKLKSSVVSFVEVLAFSESTNEKYELIAGMDSGLQNLGFSDVYPAHQPPVSRSLKSAFFRFWFPHKAALLRHVDSLGVNTSSPSHQDLQVAQVSQLRQYPAGCVHAYSFLDKGLKDEKVTERSREFCVTSASLVSS